jgi:RNA 3'-terminal phosphate cyclase (ATP)
MSRGFVELDGSAGEGGGQILRTALSLSLVTGTPFRIRNLRAKRAKPGLAPQHLAAVRACAAIGNGAVTGATLGSTTLEFAPGAVQPGHYRFDIGTAGSTALLLQALVWPLALRPEPSTLTLIGGTHVPSAPTFEYLSLCWAPTIRRLGIGISLRMPKAGFFPKGGGELRVTLRGGAALHGVRWDTPVVFDAFTGLSLQAGLKEEVAERQAAGARAVLEAAGIYCPMSTATLTALNPGTAIALLAGSRTAPVCATALGARGKPAETVGQEAAEELVRLVRARAPVDPHAADQLLLPLALAGEPSAFLTSWPTEHLRTNAQVVERFLPTRIAIAPEPRGCALVRVEPTG